MAHMLNHLRLWLLITLTSTFLAACGDGGSTRNDKEAPTLLSQPAGVTADIGGSATFTVSYTGSAPLSVQWQRDGQPIAGATAPSYTLQPVAAGDDHARFSAVVRNSLGVVVSADAVLLVKPPVAAAPAITTQPQAQSVLVGQPASFSVGATGAAPLSYQWLRNGVAIAGANAAAYTLAAASAGDNGAVFAVRVSNAQGSVTSASAALLVDSSAQPLAAATLAPQVRLLSASDESLLVASSSTELRFAGPVNLPVGSVVVGQGQAFKVVSVRSAAGQTVLGVTEPRLAELFRSLRIKGNYAAQASHLVRGNGARATDRSAQAGPDERSVNFSWPFSVSDGGLEISGTVSTKLSAAVDYDYQQDAGGLRSASLDIAAKTSLDLSATFTGSRVAEFEREVARVRIPIPVTLVDAALNVVGVSVVSIQVPVHLGASIEGELSAQMSETVQAEGNLSLRYTAAGGTSLSSAFAGDVNGLTLNPSTPGGAKVLQTYTVTPSVYLRLKPALAFVDRVAMLGVDMKLIADAPAQVQVLAANPAWCATIAPSAHLESAGFFKAVGVQPLRTDVHRSTLVQGRTTYAGNCRGPVTLAASVAAGAQPAAYGAEVPVNVTVSLDAARASGSPTSPPTGRVRVSADGASCEATLSRQSATTAVGRCSLAPRTHGPAVPLALSYPGDANYSPGAGAGQVDVQPPAQSLYGSTVTVVGYYPSLSNPSTEPLTERIGPGIEFSSGSMRNLRDDTFLVGATTDVGPTHVEQVHTEAADLLPGSFNGPVFTLGAGAPRILGCSLSPRSSYTAAQVQVSCSERELRWSMAGVRTQVGGRVVVDLRLGEPLP